MKKKILKPKKEKISKTVKKPKASKEPKVSEKPKVLSRRERKLKSLLREEEEELPLESIKDDIEDSEDVDDEEESEDVENLDEEVDDDPIYETSKTKKKTPKVAKEVFYVDPKLFDEEIVKYYTSGVLTNDLAEMVNKIAHKLSYASNFINYTYREDMVGDALIRMFKALMSKKYDREKGTNPFSYFTRIAFNAFRNRIKKEKHINETHLKYQEEIFLMSETYNSYAKNNKNSSFNDIV